MPLQIPVLLLTIANLLIPIAILVFASGFFPYKPFLPGTASFEDVDALQMPEAPFDKVVFMVVDALRRSGLHYLFYAVCERLSSAVISYTRPIQASSLPKGSCQMYRLSS